MKLLKVTANGFKNCKDNFTIDYVAKSRKTLEDKEYELQKIADELYVYSNVAFIGKNASGKTTAIDLLDCCYSILGDFRVENKHYDYNGIELEMYFYYEGDIYRYKTELFTGESVGNRAEFLNEHIYKKTYYKTKVKDIFKDTGFEQVKVNGILPGDTSMLFFILGKQMTRAVYFDSFGKGSDTYQVLFKSMKTYKITESEFLKVVKIFDDNIKNIIRVDDHNYKLSYHDRETIISDKELVYFLSSGTTKGILLYILMIASLRYGFDLLVDEIENHFHKTLVENMISLYKDKQVNKKNATLVFTTHYCEILDLFNRQDNIWISKSDGKIYIENMYEEYDIRSEILKSKQFYANTFQTAVNYEALMDMKRELMK